jgi:hypothetical protein
VYGSVVDGMAAVDAIEDGRQKLLWQNKLKKEIVNVYFCPSFKTSCNGKAFLCNYLG